MGAAEIVLIVLGVVVLILSYILPFQKEKGDMPLSQVNEEQIRKLVEKEIGNAKSHINEIVDESVTYSMEKTERAMERLTNEKIMAVKEYSDLVLDNINKNHNEVIFLYDMLNDKHKSLVSMVGEASRLEKSIHHTVQSAGEPEEAAAKTGAEKKKENIETKKRQMPNRRTNSLKANKQPSDKERFEEKEPEAADMDYVTANKDKEEAAEEKNGNNNEEILKLHKEGKEDTVIAKELGLGVGEVRLVIGLYQ